MNPARAWTVLAVALLAIASPAQAHDWFTDKVAPDGQRQCCGGSDCDHRKVRLNKDTGNPEILINGKWWPAMDPRWFLGDSPDGSWSGCQMPGDELPRCVWGGNGA